jgi:MoaA/NifB/PqqE/SkfB family radical SAM enzyme
VDLPFETMVRVMEEARDGMGVHFFILTGGEPFVHPRIFDILEQFPNCYFQIFTNGTLIGGEEARRLGRLGNAIVMVSLEGTEEETDARRREGAFRAALKAMERLLDAGVPFGYSVMTTSGNCDYVTSGDFVDWAIGMGCIVGYYFQYMPVGSDPDISLMPSPLQRDACRKRVYRLRNEKPIVLIDVINDGPLTGGCTSSGRRYVHILANGDVTPCVYSNFSTDNIGEMTLTEALRGPFLSTLRRTIPFEGNMLRCCLLLDRPRFYIRMLDLHHPRSTVPSEGERIRILKPTLEEYARGMRSIYDPAWERGDWESLISGIDWEIGRRG